MTRQAMWTGYIFSALCALTIVQLVSCKDTRDGVFTVSFSNGTPSALPYEIPRGFKHTPTPGSVGAIPDAASKCCMQLPTSHEVSWYDSMKFSLHSSSDCHASSKVCSLPGKVAAVWVCGCPGGDCSGEHVVVGTTPVLDSAAALQASTTMNVVASSTVWVFTQQGFPTRISALLSGGSSHLLASSDSSSSATCDIRGFKVEHIQRSVTVGHAPHSKASKVALGSGLKKDPVVAVLYQTSDGCLTYVMMRTRSGRTGQAGRLNPALPMQTATAPPGAEGLAGLEASVLQQPHQQQQREPGGVIKTAPGDAEGMVSLQLIWGVSQCSLRSSELRKAAAQQGTALSVAAVKPSAGAKTAAAAAAAAEPKQVAAAAAAPAPPTAAPVAAISIASARTPAADLNTPGVGSPSQELHVSSTPADAVRAAAAAATAAAAAAKKSAAAAAAAAAAAQAAASRTKTPAPTVRLAAPPVPAAAPATAASVAAAAQAPSAATKAAAAPPLPVPLPLSVPPSSTTFASSAPAQSAKGPAHSAHSTGAAAAAVASAAAAAAATQRLLQAAKHSPMVAKSATLAAAAPATSQARAAAAPGDASSGTAALMAAMTALAAAASPAMQQPVPVPSAHPASARRFFGPQRRPDAAVATAAVAAAQPAALTAPAAAAAAAAARQQPATSSTSGIAAQAAAAASSMPSNAGLQMGVASAAAEDSKAEECQDCWRVQSHVQSTGQVALQQPTLHKGPGVSMGFTAAQIAAALKPRLAALAARPIGAGRRLAEAAEAALENGGQGGAAAEVLQADSHVQAGDGSSSSSSRLKPCRLSDPFCFTDEECYCKLANGTFGAACPMFGTCLGACCSTTGVCPGRMGFEDPKTGQQSVLLPTTCSDWGLNEGGSQPTLNPDGLGWAGSVDCKLPRGRSCVPGAAGAACMGYTVDACQGEGWGAPQGQASMAGAMCVFNQEGSSRHFDVCSCVPVY